LFGTNKWILLSLLILFASQQAIFVFARAAPWGYHSGSDPINDFHIASVISENEHFELGHVGYASRPAYSYYPLMHLASVLIQKTSGLPLAFVALYVIPMFNALMVPTILFLLNRDLFRLRGRTLCIATLLFATGSYYFSFQSAFVRETFAFPFALISIWIATRILTNKSRVYIALISVSFFVVFLSHHVTSYVLIAILVTMAFSSHVFHGNKKLNRIVLLLIIMCLTYTIFVVFDFAISQVGYAFKAIQSIFAISHTPSVLAHSEPLRQYVVYSDYLVLGALTIVGWVYLLHKARKKNEVVITLSSLFILLFVTCVLLRLSVSAQVWSWTYYMSLRGTIWASIGVVVVAAIGLERLTKFTARLNLKKCIVMFLLFSMLSIGQFFQYPSLVNDPATKPNISDLQYTSTVWLKEYTNHGSALLVAPYTEGLDAFETSRNMAPYAYLKEYFLDWMPYDRFVGYVPFVGKFFERLQSETGIQIVYNDGATRIGYKQR
jgi:hypothetical protein